MNVSFGDFTFRDDTRQLIRADAVVHLSPKAFDLLRMLLEARPKAMSKTELSSQLWPATFVTDANLSVLIAEIRAALGDRPQNPRFVRTVHRYGYAFCGTAADVPAPGSRALSTTVADGAACWLISDDGRTPLANGIHVIGRDPQAEVWIDRPGVSRRHARIEIRDDQATVADLESKNGTFVRGERVTSATTVRDGDHIRVGPVTFTFRTSVISETTV
jgi:DNA-binding winged helix-turn-helix (wHTH) protein